MTVETTDSRVQYETNGTTGPWTVPFYFLADADLQVIYTNSSGAETTLVLTTNYSVTGAGNPSGGTVTTVTAYPAGGTITISNEVEALQEVDYTETDSFPAETHERALDRLTMLAQRAIRTVARALKIPASDNTDMSLPGPASRAERVLGFDSDGKPIMLTRTDDGGSALALDLASTSDASKGSGMVGYLRSLASAVATTVREWLGWQDVDPFEFMSAAQRADVIAGTSTLDVSAAWQACITAAAGKPIRMRGGVHRIDNALGYVTSGESPGLKIRGDGSGKAFFDTRVANNFMLTVDGTGTPSTYALGLELEGFSVITNAAEVNSGGILVKGQWLGSIRKNKIKGLTSDGLKIVNDNSDADASGFLTIEKNWIQGNGGWGITTPDPATSSNASGHISIKKNYITSNALGGVRLLGAKIELTENSIAYNTGGGGLVIPYSATSGVPNLLDIDRNEFDGNTGYQIDVQACIGAKVTHNKFVYRANGVGIRIGDGGAGSVQDVHCDSNYHRRDAGTVTAHSIGSNAYYTQVKSAYYPTLTGVTKITDAGTNTEIFDSGKWTKSAVGTKTTTGATSYTPVIGDAVYHRIVINATGAFTVNDPTDGGDGMELELDVYNISGGAVTVTFGASYGTAGFTNPADGKRKTARFRYHSTSGKWMQMGSWSPDI